MTCPADGCLAPSPCSEPEIAKLEHIRANAALPDHIDDDVSAWIQAHRNVDRRGDSAEGVDEFLALTANKPRSNVADKTTDEIRADRIVQDGLEAMRRNQVKEAKAE